MNRRRQFAIIFSTLLAVASALVPFHLEAQQTDRAKVVGRKLMCMCGCGQILTECNHINCPSSRPMLKELDAIVTKGEPDDLILQDFVQKYGQKVLSEPPTTGFNSLAWYIPAIAFALGLGIVIVLIRMWRERDIARLASASGAPVPEHTAASVLHDAELDRLRKQVDRDTDE
jgi:cytochrome c-type biogenesis protein CcmH/NrfF